MSTTKPAIVVDKLRISMLGGKTHIVDDVSFEIAPGEVLGLVGESGSGKTTVGLALLGHARRGVEITGGNFGPVPEYLDVEPPIRGAGGDLDRPFAGPPECGLDERTDRDPEPARVDQHVHLLARPPDLRVFRIHAG